jgi:hypothetical protein
MAAMPLRRESDTELHFAHAPSSGWLFAAIGIAIAVEGPHFIDEDAWQWMVVVFGVLCVAIGMGGAFWRFELTFDLLTRTYRGRKGFWPSPRPLQGSFEQIEGVVLTRKWWRRSGSNGGSRAHAVWSVGLALPGWDEPVSVLESTREEKGYRLLEELARKLQVAALDRTGESETRRSWQHLDRPLAEADPVEAGSGAPGQPPADSRIEWLPLSGASRIALPPSGISLGAFLMVLFGLAFAAFGTLALLAVSGIWDVPFEGSRATAWGLGGVFVLVGLGIVVLALVGSFGREVVHEEPGVLVYRIEFLGRSIRRVPLPKREIERVARVSATKAHRGGAAARVGGVQVGVTSRAGEVPHEVQIRSDRRIVRLGAGLRPDEQAWLERALSHLAACAP